MMKVLIMNLEDARQVLTEAGINVDAVAPQVQDKFVSAFVRAKKPQNCCGLTAALPPCKRADHER